MAEQLTTAVMKKVLVARCSDGRFLKRWSDMQTSGYEPTTDVFDAYWVHPSDPEEFRFPRKPASHYLRNVRGDCPYPDAEMVVVDLRATYCTD